jgi:cyanophycinase
LAAATPPRLVHCPAARESCRPAPGNDGAALAEHLERTFDVWRQLQADGRVSDLTFITTNTPADANRAGFVEPLTRAQGLWFCGGDQAPLAKLFVDPLRPTLFQQEVFKILRRGGAVGGSSAGLAIMADVMIEGGISEDGRPAAAELSRGLGVMKHVLAEQHFDARSGRIERLTGLLRDHKRLANFSPTCRPKQMIALAVEEDTALVVQGSRLRVAGKKLAHVFVQGDDPRLVIWHALKPGDVAVMLTFRRGFALELEDWQFGE